MKRLALIALLAGMLSAPAWADYDAALEAREAAQRKAEQQESARRKAEAARTQAAATAKYQRDFVGAEAQGKSDAEVKQLYDKKMAAINKQAAEATKLYGGVGSTGGTINVQDAQALAREMEKKYGK